MSAAYLWATSHMVIIYAIAAYIVISLILMLILKPAGKAGWLVSTLVQIVSAVFLIAGQLPVLIPEDKLQFAGMTWNIQGLNQLVIGAAVLVLNLLLIVLFQQSAARPKKVKIKKAKEKIIKEKKSKEKGKPEKPGQPEKPVKEKPEKQVKEARKEKAVWEKSKPEKTSKDKKVKNESGAGRKISLTGEYEIIIDPTVFGIKTSEETVEEDDDTFEMINELIEKGDKENAVKYLRMMAFYAKNQESKEYAQKKLAELSE